MASTIYIMEAANLYCGDHDPANSKHLTLEELKLPDLQEVLVDHQPGGGKVGVEFAVGVEKLEPTFNLKGWDPVLLRQFGLGSRERRVFTAYGVVRDKRSGRAIEAKAVMEGRLSRIAPAAFQRGEAMSHEYSINEVLHYEVHFDGAEEMYWDFFTNTFRLGGVDPDPEFNNILRIGNAG
ncbi:phage major tail tube protein [Chelatococcus sp. XZ-Ab1]|uniref:phage major tail tube protein n=1 Tax=Chelatococcus sp. XZ-Ab1 TaxID=3034027 RepID=UPI0023E413BC|nr:phage major tail tube protein [Chelatococcus sp. XZ-Ab1]